MRGRDDVYEDWTVDLRDLTGRHCTEAESCRTVFMNKRLKYQISVCAWSYVNASTNRFLRIIYMYTTCVAVGETRYRSVPQTGGTDRYWPNLIQKKSRMRPACQVFETHFFTLSKAKIL